MRIGPAALCASCSFLLGGCWHDYLLERQLLAEAKQAEPAAKQQGLTVAVPAVPFPVTPPGARADSVPRVYVRASRLHVDRDTPGAKYLRVSARDHRSHRWSGGILLGLGLASLLGGAVAIPLIANSSCPPYQPSEDCGLGKAIFSIVVSGPLFLSGLGETIAGVTLLGLGARRSEIGPDEAHTLYLPQPAQPAPPPLGLLLRY